MTVWENLAMGAFIRRQEPAAEIEPRHGARLRLVPALAERSGQYAGTLSGGEQQMLAIGRALMARPRLLLMDEPSMGLAPAFVDQVFDIIQTINQQGTTILVVEQNAAVALVDRAPWLRPAERSHRPCTTVPPRCSPPMTSGAPISGRIER